MKLTRLAAILIAPAMLIGSFTAVYTEELGVTGEPEIMAADVTKASLNYRLVWEANDHDDRGWFTVGSGDEYSYTMTREIAEREANRE